MKLKTKLFVALSACALVGGASAGLMASKDAVEVKAESAFIYCECNQSWWNAEGAAVGIYAYKDDGEVENAPYPGVRMTKADTVDGVWYANIDLSPYDHVIFTRVNAGGDIADWGAKTSDLSLDGATNYYKITSSSAVWGDPGVAGKWISGGYTHIADDLSLTFYASSAHNTDEPAPKVYVWGDCVTDEKPAFPGTSMTKTTENVTFLGSNLYRHTIHYESHWADRSDVSISMVISNNGNANKTGDINVIADGSYYSPNDSQYWYNGYTADASKGVAAAVAFDVSETDVCNLTESKAEQLRKDLEDNEAYLSTTIWGEDNTTYSEALKWIDSQCAAPKHTAIVNPISQSVSSRNLPYACAAIVGIGLVLTICGFIFARKRRND